MTISYVGKGGDSQCRIVFEIRYSLPLYKQRCLVSSRAFFPKKPPATCSRTAWIFRWCTMGPDDPMWVSQITLDIPNGTRYQCLTLLCSVFHIWVSLQRCSCDAEEQSFPTANGSALPSSCTSGFYFQVCAETAGNLGKNHHENQGTVTPRSVSYMELLLALKLCTWNGFWFLFHG